MGLSGPFPTSAIVVLTMLVSGTVLGDATSPDDAAATYARLAHLKSLDSTGPPELRVWYTDVMVAHEVQGYIVTAASIKRCQLPERLDVKHSVRMYGAPRCRTSVNGRRAEELLKLIPALKATKLVECKVMDGYEADVEATVDGERLTLSLDNPDECNDIFRKVNELLWNWNKPLIPPESGR